MPAAALVWRDGASLAGTQLPFAIATSQQPDDSFGDHSEFRFVDVDADGFDDVVATVPDTPGIGRLLLFRGPIGSATTSIDATVDEHGIVAGLGG